ncbi:hypothetical protein RND81_03G115700 [Saponaria officinalis]|uniref:Uncharacterized protein n=1 Tax=Saponaria officinalis TaxID=3572 RepID=A0AAW1M6E0_SAPOF
MSVWWVWKWRNHRVFAREDEIPMNAAGFLYKRINEVLRAKITGDDMQADPREKKKEILVRWVAPPVDWVVLNIDGASKGNPGSSGAGDYLETRLVGYFLRFRSGSDWLL